jgi:transketolase
MERQKENIHRAIMEEIATMTSENEDLFIVSPDFELSVRKYMDLKYPPNRVVDVGIAETNMISVAAGMAYSGKIIFTTTIAPFTTAKVAEHIRIDCCYPNLNVTMFGLGRGLGYAHAGATHQATEDIAMLRAIPNMTVLLPADGTEIRKMIRAAVKYPGTKYIGLSTAEGPAIYEEDYNFQIGKAVILKEGRDIALISAGSVVVETLDAADMLEKEGIKARVINMHTVQPLDEEVVVRAAKDTGAIVTVEDHSIRSGLGAAIAEVLVEQYPIPMKRIGTPDCFPVIGKFKEVLHKYEMDSPAIVVAAKDLLKKVKKVSYPQ